MSLDGNDAENCEHNWSEVNLDGIKVADVTNIEVAEHADGGVGEHDHGEAQVILLPHNNAGKGEEELGKDDYDGCKGLNHLLLLIELVEFPPSIKELLSHFTLKDGFGQSVVVSLLAVTMQRGIGLLTFLLEFDSCGVDENLFKDDNSKNGIGCVD